MHICVTKGQDLHSMGLYEKGQRSTTTYKPISVETQCEIVPAQPPSQEGFRAIISGC